MQFSIYHLLFIIRCFADAFEKQVKMDSKVVELARNAGTGAGSASSSTSLTMYSSSLTANTFLCRLSSSTTESVSNRYSCSFVLA